MRWCRATLPTPFDPATRLCIQDATLHNISLLVTASGVYHHVKHQYLSTFDGHIRQHNTKALARSLVLISSAIFDKTHTLMKKHPAFLSSVEATKLPATIGSDYDILRHGLPPAPPVSSSVPASGYLFRGDHKNITYFPVCFDAKPTNNTSGRFRIPPKKEGVSSSLFRTFSSSSSHPSPSYTSLHFSLFSAFSLRCGCLFLAPSLGMRLGFHPSSLLELLILPPILQNLASFLSFDHYFVPCFGLINGQVFREVLDNVFKFHIPCIIISAIPPLLRMTPKEESELFSSRAVSSLSAPLLSKES